MIKAKARWGGDRTVLKIGLDAKDLERLHLVPIKVNGYEVELPIDVVIFSAETEDDLWEIFDGRNRLSDRS